MASRSARSCAASASRRRPSTASGTSSSGPALNIESEEASAALALFTVQTALFGGRGASDLVLPIEPLGAIHGDAAGRALAEAGAEVRTRARVTGLESGRRGAFRR